MRVHARPPGAVNQVRERAWRETGWTVLCAAITGLAVAVATRGIEAVPAALLWVLAGALFADTLSVAARAGRLWAQWHRAMRCPACRAAQMQASDGHDRQQTCARAGHRDGQHRAVSA